MSARGITKKQKTSAEIVMERPMVTRHYKMVWDLERCVGCQIGPAVCPKEAITHVPAVLEDGHMVERASVDIDPETCIFCGMCAVMCPTQAITMTINGQTEIPIVDYEAFPKLTESTVFERELFDFELKDFVVNNCPTHVISYNEAADTMEIDDAHCIRCRQCEVASSGAFQVVQPWEGLVRLQREKCVEGCLACADICPTRALHIDDDGELVLADYYCIKCGACMQICPVKPETEKYSTVFHVKEIEVRRVRERVLNEPDLPIWVERWRVKHTPVDSGAWRAALLDVADDKAGAVEIDRTRALRRRDLLKALAGGKAMLERKNHK